VDLVVEVVTGVVVVVDVAVVVEVCSIGIASQFGGSKCFFFFFSFDNYKLSWIFGVLLAIRGPSEDFS